MTDWELHYDTLYEIYGMAAVLTVSGSDGADYPLTVIPKQLPVEIGDRLGEVSRQMTVLSSQQAFAVRESELDTLGLNRADLAGSELACDGKNYRVEFYSEPGRPPNGKGEVYLVVVEL